MVTVLNKLTLKGVCHSEGAKCINRSDRRIWVGMGIQERFFANKLQRSEWQLTFCVHYIMLYEHKFLLALVVTVLTETAVLFAIGRILWKKQFTLISNARLIFTGFFCSFASLPYVWFVLPVWIKSHNMLMLVGEPFVILLEWLFYCVLLPVGKRRALLVSFCCNIISFAVGLVCF